MHAIQAHAEDYLRRLRELLDQIDFEILERINSAIQNAYRRDASIFIVGNGGSASTASHMACDLNKGTASAHAKRLRFFSLTDNMAWFSAVANDIGYEHVFTEQLESLYREGDLLLALSASGNSPNVVLALEYVKQRGGTTIAIVGFEGGRLKDLADIALHLPGKDYGTVEDAHLILNHIMVEFLRTWITNNV